MQDAGEAARQQNHNYVEPEHVLDALLDQEGGVVEQIIEKAGGNIRAVKQVIEAEIERMRMSMVVAAQVSHRAYIRY